MDIETLLDKKRQELETLRQKISMLKIQLCAVQINERALDAVDNALNRSGPCAPTDIEVRRGSTSNPDRRSHV